MFLKVTLRSAWYHKRLLGTTLLASWLIAGFCALIPLLLDTFSETVARRITAGIRPEMTTVSLVNRRAFAPETLSIIERELGGMIGDTVSFSRAIGDSRFPQLGKICGFDYTPGELLTARTRAAITPNDHCYAIYSFSVPSDLFRVVEGRWPQPLDVEPPAPPLRMGEPQVEPVVSAEIAQATGYEIGQRLVIGDSTEQALVVEIVGLIEPALSPDDVFWHGHLIAQTGEWTPYGMMDARFDVGLVVSSEAFDAWIQPRHPQTTYYHWWLRANPDAVTNANLRSLDARLYRLERDLLTAHPQLALVSGLKSLGEQYRADVAEFQHVVWVFAGVALALMVYQAVGIYRLSLDEARGEQAIIAGRGASIHQRVSVRAAALGLAAISSLLVGPLLARAALWALERFGPLKALPDGYSPRLSGALVGAAAGALGLCAVLLGVAWYTARFAAAQPAPSGRDRPFWRRYFLDFLLIAAGCAFLLRLYFSATGDLGASLEALQRFPATLAHQFSASEQSPDGGLADPLNILGPALLLVGLALLWLRIHAFIIRLIGLLLRRQKGLALPMAAWHAGRGAGRFAPLAVMLMALLALGFVSLALDSTYDAQARSAARHETGADVRLEYDQIAEGWESLPGVIDSAAVMRQTASGQLVVMGIDPARSFPGLEAAVEHLSGEPSLLPGWELPGDAVALQIQINTPEEPSAPTTTRLDLLLIDGRGEPFTIPATATDPVVTGRFVPYRAALPDSSAPWRLTGFAFRSEREGLTMFSHQVYLDDLAVVDAQGSVTVLEDFEQAAAIEQWTGAATLSDTAVQPAWSDAQAASGAASMRVDYRIRHSAVRALQPQLMVRKVIPPQVPVVVSESFAAWQDRQSGTEQRLQVGDVGRVPFELAGGRYQLSYRVVAIVDEFPTATATDRMIVAPFNDLRVALNSQSSQGRTFDANQVWLALDTTPPSTAFRESAAALPDVTRVAYAWDRYETMQPEPALLAITGISFAAFWFVWGLYALFCAVYLGVAGAQQDRALHILRTLGLDNHRLRRVITAERLIMLVPTLAAGVAVSVLLVSALFPFLPLIDGDTLHFSRASAVSMLLMAFMLLIPAIAFRGAGVASGQGPHPEVG